MDLKRQNTIQVCEKALCTPIEQVQQPQDLPILLYLTTHQQDISTLLAIGETLFLQRTRDTTQIGNL